MRPSPLIENIKTNLLRGNLDLAEQAYSQLWHILVVQKLKWNKELYEQLSVLGRQFMNIMNSAYSDVKKKAEQIYALINRARASLREGKKEQPFKLYSEIQEISNSIPNVFFEEKRIIERQIIDFYKEIRGTTDNELLKRVSDLIQEINRLIDNISISIRRNDITNAIVNYNRCSELYNQIPEGFFRHKNSAGMRLLDVYKSLSIYTEISILQKQIEQPPYKRAPESTPSKPVTAPAKANLKNAEAAPKSSLLKEKKEDAKKSIEKGLYNDAYRQIEEALKIEPNDTEAKVIFARIKTLQ